MQNNKDGYFDELRREKLRSSSRNPGAAALMSFFVMGLGQIYAGHVDRGITLLGIYVSGIFSIFSLYNKGILYETMGPLIGTSGLVMLSYCFCVIFILVWIYNIKDAYYLSLFSSFRDWFEVERVLLPLMENTSISKGLIEPPEGQIEIAGLTDSEKRRLPTKEEETLEEGIIEVEAGVREEENKPVTKTDNKSQAGEQKETYPEEEIDELLKKQTTMATAGRGAWKLYLGIALILLLTGMWVFKKDKTTDLQMSANENSSTLFALTAPIGEDKEKVVSQQGEKSIQTIVDNIEIKEKLPADNPEKVEEKPKVKSRYVPFIRGVEMASKGEFVKASAEFERDMEEHEPGKEVWQIILNSFYRSENKLAYEMKLRKYLESFPNDARAWFNLGKVLYDRKEFAQASQAIVRGLAQKPENVRGNFLLGSIYSDLKLYEDAVKYLQKAVSYEPLNITFVVALAESLKKNGDLKEARRFYKRVVSLDAGHTNAIEAVKAIDKKLPVVATEQKNVEEDDEIVVIQGNSSFKVVSRSDDHEETQPLSPQAVPDDSYENQNTEDEEETVKSAANKIKVAQKADKKPDPQVQSKVLFVKNEDSSVDEDEEAVLDQNALPPEVIQNGNNDVEPEASIAAETKEKTQEDESAEQKAEDKKEAERQVLASVAESGISFLEIEKKKKKQGSKLMNSVAIEDGNAKKAIEDLRKSAFKQYSLGKWESSLALYLEYLQKKKDPAAYDVVSIIFEKLGMYKDAFEAAQQAYNLGLRQINNKIRLGKLAEKSGKFAEGCKFLKAVLEEKPFRIDLRIKYARCLANTGHNQEAIKQLQAITREKSASYSVVARVKREISKIRKVND
ncbi:MAG: tetratricopeptide repeat protein [Candidatus Rifleibacteriota bacterium]